MDHRESEIEKEIPISSSRLASCLRLSAIGQLTAGVAHELNNPLSVILGFSQSLVQQYKTDAGLVSTLQLIERETLRCKRLVQDVLNYSRLPHSGKAMDDLVQVLDVALSLVEAQARIQHVEVKREITGSIPPMYMDRHRIQQMMINLCTNALDAMEKGGCLTIRVKAEVTQNKSFVEIRVEDTGVGMTPAIRDRMFEPFFTTKDLGKGTGLGLSVVQEVVREHHAQLDVLSEVGHGATFVIRLPTPAPNQRRSETNESQRTSNQA